MRATTPLRHRWPPPCVDGPRLARENVACRTEVACSHVSGPFTQSGWTAGPDGVREPRPHHSSGIDVPMKRQASLGCVGSTDCAITRHYSSRKLQRRPRRMPPVFGFRFGPGTPAHGCPSDCWDHSGYCRDGYRCIHPQEALVKKLLLAGIAASMVYTIAARAADDDPPPPSRF